MVLSVAKSRYLETSLIRPTSRGGQTPKARLSVSLRRLNPDSCPPTGSYGGKKEGKERKNKVVGMVVLAPKYISVVRVKVNP
jgi:hypothetical protein